MGYGVVGQPPEPIAVCPHAPQTAHLLPVSTVVNPALVPCVTGCPASLARLVSYNASFLTPCGRGALSLGVWRVNSTVHELWPLNAVLTSGELVCVVIYTCVHMSTCVISIPHVSAYLIPSFSSPPLSSPPSSPPSPLLPLPSPTLTLLYTALLRLQGVPAQELHLGCLFLCSCHCCAVSRY